MQSGTHVISIIQNTSSGEMLFEDVHEQYTTLKLVYIYSLLDYDNDIRYVDSDDGYWICNNSNMTGVTYGTGTAYPSAAPVFTRWFLLMFTLLDPLFSV